MQIVAGSLLLAACSALHLLLLVGAAKWLEALSAGAAGDSYALRIAKLMGGGFAAVVVAHTAHVWVWAGAFTATGALPELADAIYFSLVTYTTLGYGDVVIDSAYRIFGAMEAVTGLLSFGISTAFLVGIFGHLLKNGS